MSPFPFLFLSANISSIKVVGLLQMLCMALQRVLPSSVFPAWQSLLRINETVDRIYESDQALIGKFRIKLLGRTAILGLQFTRAGSVSFDIEHTLDTLLKALEHKVRQSSWPLPTVLG
jgi:hypothetical protein